MATPPTALLFARVKSPDLLDEVGFYSGDLRALEACGFRVVKATRYRDLVRERADLYFVWWWTRALPVVAFARLRRKPVIITGVFNFAPSDPKLDGYGDRSILQRLVIRLAAKLATANCFTSWHEYHAVSRALRLGNAHHLPPEVRCLSIDTRADVEEQSGATGQQLILNVAWSGRQNLYRKCVYELIAAFEHLAPWFPDLRLVLVGNVGDGAPELRARVEQSPFRDRIEYVGRATEAELSDLMQRADVFASPSRFEGFGLAIAEAAAVGIPIVTSDVGEVGYVLGPEGARYCDGTDPASIAEAIDWCLAQPQEAAAMAKRGQQGVDRFTLETRLRRLSEILEQVGAAPQQRADDFRP